jgi:hypothetical protein
MRFSSCGVEGALSPELSSMGLDLGEARENIGLVGIYKYVDGASSARTQKLTSNFQGFNSTENPTALITFDE